MNDAPAYNFTNDWFTRNIPTWDALFALFTPRRFLEIGSYEGQATCYLIEKFRDTPGVEICCIDTWEGGLEHNHAGMSAVEARFDHNVAVATSKAKYAPRLTKIKKLSHLALAELVASGKSDSFDVIYIDGSHQAPDVLTDAVLAFHLLSAGGLMIFDDYLWAMETHGQQDSYNIPKPAIDAFINIFQRKMLVVQGVPIYQLYAAKLGADG